MKSILVVDDDRTIRNLLKNRLEKVGFHVYTADAGQVALHMLKTTAIDLILLDQIMPDMDGLETFEKIKKEIPSPPPVIMATALDSTDLAVESMKIGLADFVVKPMDINLLKMKIEHTLKKTAERKHTEEIIREVQRCSLKNYANLEEMCSSALTAVVGLMEMDTAFVATIDDDVCEVEHCFNGKKRFYPGKTFSLENIFHKKMNNLTMPLFISNAAQSDEWKEHPMHRLMKVVSYIGIPIYVQGKLYGVFCVCSETPKRFGEFSLEITMLFVQKIEREIEKKIMHKALIEAQTLSSLSRVTATIAHEMRQPLTAADMDLAETLEILPEDAGEVGELVSSAVSRLHDALQIIRSMMKVFRSKEGNRPRDVNLNQELDDAVILFGYKTNGIEILRDYEDDAQVNTGGNVSRIFVNLIGNSLQVLENSGQIKLTTRQADKQMLVEIEDSGSGIPPEILERIFEPEFTTKKSGEGNGLGLWIAKQEIDQMGGAITVESETGKFTRFKILLPIANNHTRQE